MGRAQLVQSLSARQGRRYARLKDFRPKDQLAWFRGRWRQQRYSATTRGRTVSKNRHVVKPSGLLYEQGLAEKKVTWDCSRRIHWICDKKKDCFYYEGLSAA